jgi:ELWxxDGT repeat protein
MLHTRLLPVLVCCTLLLVGAPLPPGAAQNEVAPVHLLADLNTTTRSSIFGAAVRMGSLLYFVRFTGFSGELWRTDGTAAGTLPVYQPGERRFVANPTVLGNTLYFSLNIDEQVRRRELWRTDGTAAGTTKVYIFGDVTGLNYFSAVGGQLLFFTGNALWRSDGSEAGTAISKVFAEYFYAYQTLASSDRLFFTSNRPPGNDNSGSQLWVSNGSEAGTLPLRDFYPPTEEAAQSLRVTLRLLAIHQGLLYFEVQQAGSKQLWRSDGTAAGTLQLGPSIVGRGMVSTGDTLYFTVGDQLWQGEGTPAGSTPVIDFATLGLSFDYLNLLTVWQGAFYFVASNSTAGRELWRSDGTPAGTGLVRDIHLGPASSNIDAIWPMGDALLLTANDGLHGSELWRSTGTAEQTSLVVDLTATGTASLQGSGNALTIVDGAQAFFNVSLQTDQEYGPRDLWVTDGTAAGTRVVSNALRIASGFTLGERLVFQPYSQSQLWLSDGSAAGTLPLSNIETNAAIVARAGSKIFFYTYSGNDNELWATDGTLAGTTSLFSFASLQGLTTTGRGVSLLERKEDGSCVLRSSDGTLAGTAAAIPLPMQCGAYVAMGSVNGLLYMLWNGHYRGEGQTLWVTDGTTAGTRLLATLDEESYYGLRNVGNKLVFFRYSESEQSQEIWTSNGTVAGTQQVVRLPSNEPIYAYTQESDAQLVFFTRFTESSWQLGVTDGTASGTQIMRTSGPLSPQSTYPTALTPMSDLLLFSGEDGEPWISDGTGAGTYRLYDINPGAAPSNPFGFALVGRRLLFAADDGNHGHEPWVSEASLSLRGPAALGAPEGQATLDLRVQELSLAAGSSITLEVTLPEGVTYLGNAQNLTPMQEGNRLRFSWQADENPLRLLPLQLQLALPANAPTDQAFNVVFNASTSDPADNSADNQFSVTVKRVYRLVLPVVYR